MIAKDFAWGLVLGLLIGYAYWLIGRWLHEREMAASAESGSPMFVNDHFYYLVPADVYMQQGLFRLAAPPQACEHGFTDNWSDECPDCRH